MEKKGAPRLVGRHLSVYYPYALTECVALQQAEDYDSRGDVLISFYDAEHCRVTIHLERAALEGLKRRLLGKPDPSPR